MFYIFLKVSCGGNHTLIHAEPLENELANNSLQQIKSSDSLPPLRVVKKIIEERKENIEPFTSITPANDNNPEVLITVKESVKVMIYIGTTMFYFR